MPADWINRTFGARKALLPFLCWANAIVIGASLIALIWSDPLHNLINVVAADHLPLRAGVLLVAMGLYNVLFLMGRSLSAITIALCANVLFFGAHDFLRATAAGQIVEPHFVAAITRLIFVSLLLRIWLDDYFARAMKMGTDRIFTPRTRHLSVYQR